MYPSKPRRSSSSSGSLARSSFLPQDSDSDSESASKTSHGHAHSLRIRTRDFRRKRSSPALSTAAANSTSTSTTAAPETPQNTAFNVEFNNVRSSFDSSAETISGGVQAGLSPSAYHVHPGLHRTASSSTTLSRLGRDNKLTRFLSKTAEIMRKSPEDTGFGVLGSVGTIDGADGNSFSAKLKRPENLSIQTTLIPSSKELKSPLARTSKEVERIANIGGHAHAHTGTSTGASAGLQPSKHKHKHHYNLLRSRKDSTKSSSASNSKVSAAHGGETVYSFHPSLANNSMTVSELQNTITELEKMSLNNATLSGDTDAIADEAWTLVCSLVAPLFRCERLKTPIEEINKLVYLHLRLRDATTSTSAASAVSASPVASPPLGSLSAYEAPFTPMGAPTPTFASAGLGRSPSSSYNALTPVVGGPGAVLTEIQEFLKAGMASLLSQLYVDDHTREVRLHREQVSWPRTMSSALSSSIPGAFERCCALLWDYFYNDVFFYLQGVFLPLGDENFGSALSSWFETSGWTPTVRNTILVSYRDHVVIPLYAQTRQVDADKERKRELGTLAGSSLSLGREDERGEEEKRMYSVLVQCFSVLNGVHTSDTNQKIVESLMERFK